MGSERLAARMLGRVALRPGGWMVAVALVSACGLGVDETAGYAPFGRDRQALAEVDHPDSEAEDLPPAPATPEPTPEEDPGTVQLPQDPIPVFGAPQPPRTGAPQPFGTQPAPPPPSLPAVPPVWPFKP
jgi:hypothetical protein